MKALITCAGRLRGLSFILVLLIASNVYLAATEPLPVEKAEAHRWALAKFTGNPQPAPDLGFLLPQLKSGTLEKNARNGHALKIGARSFERGIHVPGIGTIKVHLPAPGKLFTAEIGVDSNDITYYSSLGRGSVTLSVEVAGKNSYRSAVMHEGMAALPVSVELNGATDFTLRVEGEKTAIDWTQVDLADAKVALLHGTDLTLDSLPLGPVRSDYTPEPPFSFVYGGMKSAEFLKGWASQRSTRVVDADRTEYTQTYHDPKTGLEARFVSVEYHDFPTVEWTVFFKNTGTADTPILENIEMLDSRLERNGDGEFVLHHNKGAPATPNDYEPYETPLPKNAEQKLVAHGGRPSNGDFPYFNLAWPGEGVIIVVGWPGQWSAQLTRDNANGLQVRIGQEQTHFKLLPGEDVRSPRIVMQFWSGEWRRSQNIWRRWMQAHNMPHPGGKLPPPQLAANTSREFVEMTEATAASEILFINRYEQEKLHPDYFWMDAGWYPNNGSWVNVGTWEVDPKRFPNGLKEVSDAAHAKGVKIILWFEPERVTKGTYLYDHHPEWLMTAPPNPGDQLYDPEWRLFNFGNPDALKWMTDHVDKVITEQGIDLYRQDFNMDPLNYWRASDAPDREGITEIRYVTGYLAYWDELRRRHPNMLLDACASGGRRNDIDTLRRAVPLTRSDYLLEPGEPISQQMQTMGMAQWVPYFGTGTSGEDPYVFRSQMTPGVITSWDLRRPDANTDAMRKLVDQWRTISPNYYGDFYPLTSYSLSNEVWGAMQFDRPEVGEGFLEVFRRSHSPYETTWLKVQGLDPKAGYEVRNLDTPGSHVFSGQELMEKGLEIRLEHAPQSALITYKRVNKNPASN